MLVNCESVSRESDSLVTRESRTRQTHSRVTRESRTRQTHSRVTRESRTRQTHSLVTRESRTRQTHSRVTRESRTRQTHSRVTRESLASLSLASPLWIVEQCAPVVHSVTVLHIGCIYAHWLYLWVFEESHSMPLHIVHSAAVVHIGCIYEFLKNNNRCSSLWFTVLQPDAFGVSLNLSLQSQYPWSLFNGTWQKRPRELDRRLRLEIEEMTLQM